jgi:hypothetical protein
VGYKKGRCKVEEGLGGSEVRNEFGMGDEVILEILEGMHSTYALSSYNNNSSS